MAMLDPKEKSFRFKLIAVIACCLLLFDAFFMGVPIFGSIILIFLVLASGISAIIFLFRNKRISKLYAIKALIYFISFISIIGIFKFNTYIGERNANILVNAINSYHADTGIYPENLDQLVPNYLENIPNCAYRMGDNKYRYHIDQDRTDLMYTKVPPFGRRIYYFKTAEWVYVD